uniref:Amino acid transporter n=1 Tax=Hirondellea gigas TaxID=1518452 RepID=A0A6A7FXQ2_9CRUS
MSEGKRDDFTDSDHDSDSDDSSESSEPQNKCRRILNKVSLAQWTVLGAVLAIGFGFAIQHLNPSEDALKVLGFPGKLFIRALKLIVLPFIATCMMLIPVNLGDISAAKKIGAKVLVYYLSTTFIAALIGVALFNIVQPHSAVPCDIGSPPVKIPKPVSVVDTILNIGEGVIDDNLIGAFARNNILGVLSFYLAFGFIFMKYQNTRGGHYLHQTLETVYQILMDLLALIVRFTPIAVFSLLAKEVARLEEPCIFTLLGTYIVAYFGALLTQVLVVYPLIYVVTTRKNPFPYYRKYLQAVVTAFATASSAATLPVTLRCARDSGIDKDTANFVLPLGATVNMDGSAIYYPITVLFISGIQKVNHDFGQQLLIALVSAIVSIGGAPIPSGALVFLVVVLEAAGVPVDGTLSYFIAMDWLFDRALTAANIFGDAVGAGVIDHLVKKDKKKYDDMKETTKAERARKRRESNIPSRRLSVSVMSKAQTALERFSRDAQATEMSSQSV